MGLYHLIKFKMAILKNLRTKVKIKANSALQTFALFSADACDLTVPSAFSR